MKTRPVREKDGGPVVNWLADRLMDLSSLLMKVAMPYALMYEVVSLHEDDDDEADQGQSCAEGCCPIDHSL